MKKIISGVLLFAFNASHALAQITTGGNPVTTGGDNRSVTIPLDNPLGTASFAELVQRILGWLYTLSIPIVSIMVMVGGYYILTAAGNEERLIKGRRTIVYAAIGFAVILLANGVVSLIRELTGV